MLINKCSLYDGSDCVDPDKLLADQWESEQRANKEKFKMVWNQLQV